MRISDWSSDVCSSDLRLVDIESAILPEPVYPAREDRRRDSEGLADRFADMAHGDQRQQWHMLQPHIDTHSRAHSLHELTNLQIFFVGDEVGLPVSHAVQIGSAHV